MLKNKFVLIFIITLLAYSSCSRGKRIGAICKDGWRSYSTGPGTCSHHGGVDYWLYEGD
jgi:hypothetical protein